MQLHDERAKEKQREASRRALAEHKTREAARLEEAANKQARHRRIMLLAIVVLVIAVTSIAAFALRPRTGNYDNFAKCLTAKGVVMEGEDWCQYTNAQKGMFGSSFQHIKYRQNADLKIRPTWIIDGQSYETVQSFERLSALTGCPIN